MQGNNFQVDKQPLKDIPIQIPNLEAENKILSLYGLIAKSKNENFFANTKNIELEIDKIIYKLYGLTDEEINYIKNFELEFRTGDNEE